MENTKVERYQVVAPIVYRLKTGYQWQELPAKQLFKSEASVGNVFWDTTYCTTTDTSEYGSILLWMEPFKILELNI
ncbi:MAG: hypothetical protein ACK5JD_14665 [Mangrovibacterium sp.]